MRNFTIDKQGQKESFFANFCQVDGLAIILKRNEPHLAKGQTVK
jgi:hypothetical protein